LRAALRLGCRARAAGSHGADLLGQLARSALRDAGIDTELLRAVGTSACEIVTVAGDGSQRTRYAGDRGEPVSVDVATAVDGAAAVLIDGTAPIDQQRLAELAKSRKLPVILDIDELRDGTSELIAAADVLIASERAASELAPRGELTDALEEILALGPRAVVITSCAARRSHAMTCSIRTAQARCFTARSRRQCCPSFRSRVAWSSRRPRRRCRFASSARGRGSRIATMCSRSCGRGARND